MTISYTEMRKLYATKAKQYSEEQCLSAILDIDNTLLLQTDRTSMVPMTPYVVKLWCERDAMLDRLHTLR